jgi:hypothetical protein
LLKQIKIKTLPKSSDPKSKTPKNGAISLKELKLEEWNYKENKETLIKHFF